MYENELADFKQSYEDNIKSIKLPQRLLKDYTITDCLKESENKNIYLLEKVDGTLWILKLYTAEYTSLLENEYHIIKQLGMLQSCSVLLLYAHGRYGKIRANESTCLHDC